MTHCGFTGCYSMCRTYCIYCSPFSSPKIYWEIGCYESLTVASQGHFCPEPSFVSHPAVSSVSTTASLPTPVFSMQTANSLHGTQCDCRSPPLSLYPPSRFLFPRLITLCALAARVIISERAGRGGGTERRAVQCKGGFPFLTGDDIYDVHHSWQHSNTVNCRNSRADRHSYKGRNKNTRQPARSRLPPSLRVYQSFI